MLSKEEVKHVLNLSCLTADEQELERLRARLSSMEQFIAKIKNAKTDSLEIEGQIGLKDLREDKAKESMPVESVLLNAPKQKQNAFAVPLMMEDE